MLLTFVTLKHTKACFEAMLSNSIHVTSKKQSFGVVPLDNFIFKIRQEYKKKIKINEKTSFFYELKSIYLKYKIFIQMCYFTMIFLSLCVLSSIE